MAHTPHHKQHSHHKHNPESPLAEEKKEPQETEPKDDILQAMEMEIEEGIKNAQKPKEEPALVTLTSTELDHLKKEALEYKDKYLRLLADSDNMRKRMQKERQELIQYALKNVIVEFLNPIDQMENALRFTQQGSAEIKHWGMGFQMILSQFKEVLNNNGVTAFESAGTVFDPNLHEAIEMIETDTHPAGIVIEESMRGYKMGEKTIRPARVKVAQEPRALYAEEQEEHKE